MEKDEVDYWLSELEADYRAASLSGRYRDKHIYAAIVEVISDRTNRDAAEKTVNMMDFYLKIYALMVIAVIVSKFM